MGVMDEDVIISMREFIESKRTEIQQMRTLTAYALRNKDLDADVVTGVVVETSIESTIAGLRLATVLLRGRAAHMNAADRVLVEGLALLIDQCAELHKGLLTEAE